MNNSKSKLNQPKRAKNPHYRKLTEEGFSLELAYSSPFQIGYSNLLLVKDDALLDSAVFKNNRSSNERIKSLLEGSYLGSHKSNAMEQFVNNLNGGKYD